MNTTSSFDPVQAASEHAGRPLFMGCGPWLLEAPIFYLAVGDQELDEQEGWEWIKAHRPDLAQRFSSLREMHESLAGWAWLNIKNDLGLTVEVVRAQGPRSGYTYDWETVEVLNEDLSDEGEEEAELLQELQLRSPSGEVLHTEARRILRYRRNSYPGGDYTVVVDL